MAHWLVRLGVLTLALIAFQAIFPARVAAQNGAAPVTQPAAARISLPDQVANLPAGARDGTATLILRIEAANLPQTPPVVRDEGYPDSYSVQPPQLRLMSSDVSAQNWLVLLRITGFEARLGATRYLTVVQGGQSAMLQYSVDNAYGAAFQWKVLAPPATGMTWARGSSIPVTIAIGGPVPATGVSLAQPRLMEHDSFAALDLQLCTNAEGEGCIRPTVLAAQQIHLLYLRRIGGGWVEPGNYAGTLIIAAAEKPDGDNVALSLYVSTWWLKLLGLIALMVGVGLSWSLTVGVRNMLARRELKRGIALLEQRRSDLAAALAAALLGKRAGTAPKTAEALRGAKGRLAAATGLLPPRLPSPWQPWANRAAFEAEMNALDPLLDGLDVVIRAGLVPAAKLPQAPAAAAIKKIDAKADDAGVEPLVDLRRAVSKALEEARGAGREQLIRVHEDSAPISIAKLDFEIALLSGAAWAVILLATVLVGAVAVILPDKGFGQWQDFATCILWGIGIPIAGGQLSSVGTDSIRTAFSVTKPS